MKELFTSKVMLGFVLFVLMVGYINSEQIKMDNEKNIDNKIVVVNA